MSNTWYCRNFDHCFPPLSIALLCDLARGDFALPKKRVALNIVINTLSNFCFSSFDWVVKISDIDFFSFICVLLNSDSFSIDSLWSWESSWFRSLLLSFDPEIFLNDERGSETNVKALFCPVTKCCFTELRFISAHARQ